MASHKALSGTNIHVVAAYTYANATARNAATGFVSADVGKLAWQTDNNSLWLLTATSPTWAQLGTALPFSALSSTPTTLAGYGITDAASDTELAAHEADTTSIHGIADTSLLLDTGDLTASHNHTSSSADGGVLTNDEHDGYSVYAEIAAPSSPAANTARLYSKDVAGVTKLFFKDSAGTEYDLSATGGGGSIDIDDGSTTVTSATSLTFVGGTVVDLGGGAAEYTPPGGGGGGTIYTSAYASPPGSPADGDVWIPSDSPYTAYRVSSAWVWRYKGSPITLPDALSLTAVNQGGATLTNTGGALRLLAPANGTSNFRIWQATLPGASFKLRAGVSQGSLNQNFASAGLMVRDSVGGRIVNFALYQAGGVMVQQYTGFTSGFSSTPFVSSGGYFPDYLEIEEDATTRYFRVGRLGFAMTTVYSHAVATWLTTDKVGIYADSNNGTHDAFLEVWDLTLT